MGCCAVGANDVNLGVAESVAEFVARDVGLGGVVAGVAGYFVRRVFRLLFRRRLPWVCWLVFGCSGPVFVFA